MKRIQFIRTFVIGAMVMGLFLLTSATILFHQIYPENRPDNLLVNYLLRGITIHSAAPDDQWLKKYPYNTAWYKQYTERSNEWKEHVESYCTVSFPESERVNHYATALKEKVYRFRLDEINNIHGNYIFVKDAADHTTAFAKLLASEGIPFLYIQTPLKGSIEYYQGLAVSGSDLVYAQRNEALCDLLQGAGINLMNIGKNVQDMFSFDASNHWFPENALEVAGLIAEKLNQDYGFSFSLLDFDPANYEDYLIEFPHIRDEIQLNCGYEYRLPVSHQQHQYSITYAERAQWSGDFSSALLRHPSQWDMKGTAYHASFFLSNSLMYDIRNETTKTNSGKTILIISDSYDWPLGAYLAGGISRLILINNSTFTGSLITYIRDVNPDIVVMAYNDAQFFEESSMEKAFDLE